MSQPAQGTATKRFSPLGVLSGSAGAGSGQAYVYVDGVKAATVDLPTAATGYRQAVWTKSWSAAAEHTVK